MKKLIFIFLAVGLIRCSSIKISHQLYKKDIYVIQQLEIADIYYPREKIIMAAISKFRLTDSLEQSALTQLKNTKKDIYLRPLDKESSRKDAIWAILMTPISLDLLLSGDVVVFDQRNGKFTKKIKYKINRSNQIINNVSFMFEDGTEFYHEQIAITEIDY